jgi:hypothetical protein
MSITDRNCNPTFAGRGGPGATTLEAIVRRWCLTSRDIRKALSNIRDPRLRADIQRLIDVYLTGREPEPAPVPTEPAPVPTEPAPVPSERAEALAEVCEALLRQFDDEQAGAAEIRLVVHKREERPGAPTLGPRPDVESPAGIEDEELVWELRRLIASSGGAIADVAHALEKRGDEVDRRGRDLLHEELLAVEVDIAVLKTLLSDQVDWDTECKRLLAGEVPPFEDLAVDDDDDEDD